MSAEIGYLASQLADLQARRARGEISRKRLWQLIRKLQGKCDKCGRDPAQCDHVRRDNERKAAAYRRKRSVVEAKLHKCSVCHAPGHNKRRCQQAQEGSA